MLLGSLVAGCSRIDYGNPTPEDIPRLVIEAYNDVNRGFDIRDLNIYGRREYIENDFPALRAIRDLVLTHPDGLITLVRLYGDDDRELRVKAVLITRLLLNFDAISFRDLPRERLDEVVAALEPFLQDDDAVTRRVAELLLRGVRKAIARARTAEAEAGRSLCGV